MLADAVPRWKFWRRRGAVLELQATLDTLSEQQQQLTQQMNSLSEQVHVLTQQLEALSTAASVPAADEPEVADDGNAELIATADALHAANDHDALFDLLKGADTQDVDLAWRIARAYHDKAEESAAAAADKALKEALLRDGLSIAEASKEATGSGYALKWYGILLGRLGDFLPTKEKIGNSYKIKEALEGAAALLPEDASVQTALGQWCYKVASISWIERNVAKTLFGDPPECASGDTQTLVFPSRSERPAIVTRVRQRRTRRRSPSCPSRTRFARRKRRRSSRGFATPS